MPSNEELLAEVNQIKKAVQSDFQLYDAEDQAAVASYVKAVLQLKVYYALQEQDKLMRTVYGVGSKT